jgi:hypothetical protein
MKLLRARAEAAEAVDASLANEPLGEQYRAKHRRAKAELSKAWQDISRLEFEKAKAEHALLSSQAHAADVEARLTAATTLVSRQASELEAATQKIRQLEQHVSKLVEEHMGAQLKAEHALSKAVLAERREIALSLRVAECQVMQATLVRQIREHEHTIAALHSRLHEARPDLDSSKLRALPRGDASS